MALSASAAQLSFEKDLLDVAHRAARAAGGELLSRWRKPLQVSTKSTDTDPVTEADVAAEHAVRHVLARERPLDSILGEEGGDTLGVGVGARAGKAAADAGPSGLRWVVDPLDGTVNYLYGLANFGVSVAVEDEEGAIAGVVLDPVRGEWFAATRNGPALHFTSGSGPADGQVLSGSSCTSLQLALVATGFAYEPSVRSAQGRIVARLLPLVRDIRRAGAAALDLGSAAAGRVDAYYERGVKPWDVRAGALICARAGLQVRTIAAEPNADGSGELPEGILVAPEALIDELERLVTVDPVTWLLEHRGI